MHNTWCGQSELPRTFVRDGSITKDLIRRDDKSAREDGLPRSNIFLYPPGINVSLSIRILAPGASCKRFMARPARRNGSITRLHKPRVVLCGDCPMDKFQL
jgi:hypothetical protein